MASQDSLNRLIRPADLPDNFTRSLYKIAPYRGCAHACRYCDGRAERYYVEGDFEKDIVDRPDIPDRLLADLPRLRESGMIAFGSGTTDPYQPREAELGITGRCAEILANYTGEGRLRIPALVMTKSRLVLRDLELWRRINEKSGFVLLVSLTSLDEDLRRRMEPGASSFQERLEVLRAFKAAGCGTGILAMPFLPGLSDGEASIRALYEAAAELEVDFIMPGGLTLRPGRQKDLYLDTISSFRPDLSPLLRDIYSEERASGAPRNSAMKDLADRIASIQKDYDLPWLLPHKCFARLLPAHDSFRILLLDMLELYRSKAVDTSRLRQSSRRYDAWLVAQRRIFRRSRSLDPSWLEGRLAQALNDGELGEILANDKLLAFSRKIINDGYYLDYASLELRPS